MSNTKECEDLRCRICLRTEVDELMSLFCVAATQKMLLAHMVLASTGIPISTMDKLPQLMCDECMESLDVAYACWKRCRQSWGNFKRFKPQNDEDRYNRCRLCLKHDATELVLLGGICEGQILSISEMIQQFAGIDIIENDDFPRYICDICLNDLITGFEFRTLCRQSNESLRKPLTKDATLELKIQERKSGIDAILCNDSVSINNILRKSKTCLNEIPSQFKTLSKTTAAKNPKSKSSNIATKTVSRKKSTQVAKTTAGSTPTNANLDEASTVAKTSSPSQPRKLYFSSSSELKELIKSTPLKKTAEPKQQSTTPPEKWQTVASESVLIPHRYEDMDKKKHFSVSKILSFMCSVCRMTYAVNAILAKCAKCQLPVKNFRPIQTAQALANDEFQIGFRCNECDFYTVMNEMIILHVKKHNNQTTQFIDTEWEEEIALTEIKEETDCVTEGGGEADPLDISRIELNRTISNKSQSVNNSITGKTPQHSSPTNDSNRSTNERNKEGNIRPVETESHNTRQRRSKFGVSKQNDDFVYC